MGCRPYSRMSWRQSSKAISNGTTRRLCRTSTSTAFSFPEAATVFADPAAVYLDDGSGTDRWLSLEPHCAIEFFMSCMSSEAGAIESSVRDQQREPNETSMSPETTHDPVS
jgi:hypothetical protein